MLALPSAYMATCVEEWLWVYNNSRSSGSSERPDQWFSQHLFCNWKERHRRRHQSTLSLLFFSWLALTRQHSPRPSAHSMSSDRQKMLSFTPCVTIRANSIKIPSEEERWNCVMVVGALNLVMILSRGKWSCRAYIMINSLQSTRCSFLHPPTSLLACRILLP